MFINNFDPVAIQIFSVEIRWYSLAYIVGILIGWILSKKIFISNLNIKEKFDDFVTYAIIGIIVGGRLGYILFYNLSYYSNNFFEIFKVWQGGMSFHGGLIGVMVAMWFYANKKNFTFFQVTDWIAPQVPIALFLGRVANFINAELYGRPTDVSWGMVFPTDPLGLVRHPSQLYEAFLEGILLFLFLNFVIAKKNKVGRHSAYFLIGYGIARSIVEFYKTPDTVWGNDFLLFSFLTQGQLLSIPMIILGIFILSKK